MSEVSVQGDPGKRYAAVTEWAESFDSVHQDLDRLSSRSLRDKVGVPPQNPSKSSALDHEVGRGHEILLRKLNVADFRRVRASKTHHDFFRRVVGPVVGDQYLVSEVHDRPNASLSPVLLILAQGNDADALGPENRRRRDHSGIRQVGKRLTWHASTRLYLDL